MDKELIPSSSQNDVTGDHIITKASNEVYRSGWDRIFGKKADPSASLLDPNVGSSDLSDGSKGYYEWSEDKPRNNWIR